MLCIVVPSSLNYICSCEVEIQIVFDKIGLLKLSVFPVVFDILILVSKRKVKCDCLDVLKLSIERSGFEILMQLFNHISSTIDYFQSAKKVC